VGLLIGVAAVISIATLALLVTLSIWLILTGVIVVVALAALVRALMPKHPRDEPLTAEYSVIVDEASASRARESREISQQRNEEIPREPGHS
jgi:hypothetical protein